MNMSIIEINIRFSYFLSRGNIFDSSGRWHWIYVSISCSFFYVIINSWYFVKLVAIRALFILLFYLSVIARVTNLPLKSIIKDVLGICNYRDKNLVPHHRDLTCIHNIWVLFYFSKSCSHYQRQYCSLHTDLEMQILIMNVRIKDNYIFGGRSAYLEGS